MIHNIALLMIGEGLLTREALERAVGRKRVQGGSLALNLVLEGAVDELSLAEFYSRKLGLQPANEEMLLGIDPATFHLIPLEIVYESGILPLYHQGDENLVVGLVDPTDSELLAEAAFFSGYNLTPRIITVSQMARHFARLARQPWKMSVEEAARVMRSRPVRTTGLHDVDALLEQTTAFDHHVDARLQASLDETYGEPTIPMESPFAQEEEPTPIGLWSIGDATPMPEESESPSIWVAGRSLEEISQIRLKPIRPEAEAEPPAVVVDEALMERAVASTAQRMAVQRFDTEPYPSPLSEIEVSAEMVDTLGLRAYEPTDPDRPIVVEGDVTTATGRMQVLGFAMEHGPTAPDGYDAADPVPVVAERASGFANRPRTKVPARPPQNPVEPPVHDHLHPMARLADTLGPPDPAVVAALDAIVDQLDRVRLRDELGDSVVYGLSDLYDTVAVMTLNGPRAVVWRCQVAGRPAPDKVGSTVDLEAGSLLHRVSEEQLFYWGGLPRQSPLRELFGVRHDGPVLVAPVGMRGRTILMVLLDAGGRAFRSPGDHLERLLIELARGLERVILLRRHGRRKA